MDSVICDLMTEWHRRYNKDYDDDLSVSKLECWDSEKYVKEECGEKIYDYLDEPGLFLSLEPLDNAIQVLERLHKQFDIFICTSSRKYAYTEKEKWVEKNLPFLGRDRMIFAQRKDMIIGDLLFDDAPHHLEAFKEKGRSVVAMDYPYNRQIDVPRVDNWLAFEAFVLERWAYDER
nr:5'(3')-deoxyribonucleotidase [Alteribacter salitolerans]